MTLIPPSLLTGLNKLEHFNAQDFIKVHDEGNPPVSLRINPLKKVEPDFELTKKVPWCEHGFYLDKRPYFTHEPLFHAGTYYVQEAGSMFIERALKSVLDFTKNLKVLDVCASPGGKSTLINSLLNEESLLVANELIKSRSDVLAQNLSKWGSNNTIVTNSETSRFSDLDSFFDCLVVDAPCSGSGLFRKQPEAIYEWSEENVNACGLRQKEILENVLPSLKPGGILVYSTCSYSVEENETIAEWLKENFGMEYVPISIEKDWGIVESNYGYRFYPHLTESEGFFCSVFRKKGDAEEPEKYNFKTQSNLSKTEYDLISPFVKSTAPILVKKNNRFYFLNKAAYDFLNRFEKQFYFKKAGVLMGEIKGKDFLPSHELALSVNLGDAAQGIDLDKENALRYLKKENFSYTGNEKGLVLIKYKNQGIGWAKVLNNRINNYLPNDWRVLR